jgi:MFS family permease
VATTVSIPSTGLALMLTFGATGLRSQVMGRAAPGTSPGTAQFPTPPSGEIRDPSAPWEGGVCMVPPAPPIPREPGRHPILPRRWGFVAVAYAFAVGMFGTTLPTPLYPLYEEKFGFGEFTVTVVFATYAVGVLAALLFAGGVSDTAGRRRVLIPALVLGAVSAVVFLTATDLAALLVGRLLSGLSAGLVTGTATATLVDLAAPGRSAGASRTATLVNMGGRGLGAFVSGVASTVLAPPLTVPFVIDLVLLVPAVAGLWSAPEPVPPTGPWRLTWPRLALPPSVRGVFVPAVIAGFAGFVVLGFFTAVSPAALGELLGVHNRAAVGSVVFVVFVASLVGQLAPTRSSVLTTLRTGCLILVVGMGGLVAGLQIPSLGLLIGGGVVAGIGQGLIMRAGIASISGATPPALRGAVMSAFFALLYVGISLPVVSIGLGARSHGLLAAATTCAVAVALLAVAAALLLVRLQRREGRREETT